MRFNTPVRIRSAANSAKTTAQVSREIFGRFPVVKGGSFCTFSVVDMLFS
jgi:hypothetical protein